MQQNTPIDKVDFVMGIIVGFIIGVVFVAALYFIKNPSAL